MLPPETLVSATVLLCERFLQDAEGILTIYRLLDIFWVPPHPIEGEPQTITFAIVSSFKTVFGYEGVHRVQLDLLNDQTGAIGHLFDNPECLFKGTAEGAPGGCAIALQMGLTVRSYGLFFVIAKIDGVEVSRASPSLLQGPAPRRSMTPVQILPDMP
jgi:hypothetical protein